jgi:hypothetical protein
MLGRQYGYLGAFYVLARARPGSGNCAFTCELVIARVVHACRVMPRDVMTHYVCNTKRRESHTQPVEVSLACEM